MARHRHGPIRDLRTEMIDETSAFISWALRNGHRVPRIPRKRVEEGGFSELIRNPRARRTVTRWWSSLLSKQWR